VASGDLTGGSLLANTRDEFGSLAKAVNQMIQNLKDIAYRLTGKARELTEQTHGFGRMPAGTIEALPVSMASLTIYIFQLWRLLAVLGKELFKKRRMKNKKCTELLTAKSRSFPD
jgi:hypothetical protein